MKPCHFSPSRSNPPRPRFQSALTLPLVLAAWFMGIVLGRAAEPSPLRVLFLGDTGHHNPADRFKQLQPGFAKQGIQMDYTESLADLNPAKLAGYDCLAIYANTTRLAPEQEQAMLDFVAAGGGLVPIHCASYCFLNSEKYIELVGRDRRISICPLYISPFLGLIPQVGQRTHFP